MAARDDYRVPAYVIDDVASGEGLRNLDHDREVTARTLLITLAIDVDDYCRESDETLTEAMVEKIGQDVNHDAGHIFGYCGWSLTLTDKEA